MTQYYDMFLAVNTRRDAPQHVIETLKFLTREEDYEFEFPPDFPLLFEDDDNENKNILRSPDEHLDFDRFFGSGFLIFHACKRMIPEYVTSSPAPYEGELPTIAVYAV